MSARAGDSCRAGLAACGRSGACPGDRRTSGFRPRRLDTEAACDGPVRRFGFPDHRPADLGDRGDRDFRAPHRTVRRPGTGCWRLAAVDQGTLRSLGLSWRKAATSWIWRSVSAMGACPRPSCISCRSRGDQAAHRSQGNRRVDRAGRASHRAAPARCRPPGRPGPAPRGPGALRPGPPPGPGRGGGPGAALAAVPEPGLQPAAGRRETDLIRTG